MIIMNFEMQELKLDMGTTPFENMFLNTYLQMADGDAIKVYLLIYKEIYNNNEVDEGKIKRQLNFDDERFNDAVRFWINMGIFREKKNSKGETYIEIISLRQMYFGESDQTSPSNEINFDKAQRKSIMFENIERIIARKLTPADITRIHETLGEYDQDPELVTEAFRQAKEAGNVDVKYVMGYLKTWRDMGINSLNELRMKEERDKLRRSSGVRVYKRKSDSRINKNKATDGMSIAEKARRKRLERLNNPED
ncbi:DnaD domain-containing protein [uncultured Anaerococcus sp.]|uniref:DnaD domain-containing protein n=1 Tax=uncultured Anaerococcus sp. TaxID=293428 RepID=UPI0025D7EC03|nr:DnaD domain protein [uncultured Anaerococcus sp.]